MIGLNQYHIRIIFIGSKYKTMCEITQQLVLSANDPDRIQCSDHFSSSDIVANIYFIQQYLNKESS